MANKSKKTPNLNLLVASDSEEEDTEFTINKSYAQNYENWRSKEELQKLKDRGIGPSVQVDSEDESSDSDTSLETDSTEEKEFFRTLSCLRAADPKIYDSSATFFSAIKTEESDKGKDGERSSKSEKKKKHDKPFLLKDHDREMVLRTAASGSVSSEDDHEEPPSNLNSGTYVAEQDSIKKSFKLASKLIDSNETGDDYDDSDLLKKKTKSKVEIQQQTDDYKKWLKGEVDKLKGGGSKQDEKELNFLRNYWNKSELDDEERFLKDFFLNKKYIEEDDGETSQEGTKSKSILPEDLSEDEAHVQEMETFEHKYNFRFEEPDTEFVKKYPRTIEDSLRRTSSKRKEEREKKHEKKQQIREQKLAEVQQYKALKRKEIQSKIEQLKTISGEEGFLDEDIDEDFDPEKHDNRMREIFNEQYYNVDEDEEKPVFPYDELIDGDDEEEEEDDDTQEPESDCDILKLPNKNKKSSSGNGNECLPSTSNGLRNAKKKSRGRGDTNQDGSGKEKKPVFNSEIHGTYDQYLNEYFKYDFEDIVGDIPCRFKYRNVVPNDFGLTTEEILEANDQELNQWASLKKTYLYRPIEEETYEVKAYSKNGNLAEKKKKVLKSVYEKPDPTEAEAESIKIPAEDGESSKSKKKQKKKKNKDKSKLEGNSTTIAKQVQTSNKKKKKDKSKSEGNSTVTEPVQKKTSNQETSNKKKKNDNGPHKRQNDNQLDEDRLLAYGINPKKYEKRMKYKV